MFQETLPKKHFCFFEMHIKKKNKSLEVNETFFEKDPSNEVGLHVDGTNFDADEVNTTIIAMMKKGE